MEPRKKMKTWYTKPSWDSRGNMIRSPTPLTNTSTRLPAPSPPSLLSQSSSACHNMSPHIPLAPLTSRSSASPLPGFATFLTRHRADSSVPMVLPGKTSSGGSQNMIQSSTGNTIWPAMPSSYASSTSLNSQWNSPPPVRSAAPPQAWSVTQQVSRQYLGPEIREVYSPISNSPRVTAASSDLETVTSGGSQESSPVYFRPVGMMVKNQSLPSIPYTCAVSQPGGGQTQSISIPSSSFSYCAPSPAPYMLCTATGNNSSWKGNTSDGSWKCDNKALKDTKGQVRSYGLSVPSNTVQSSCGMYPVSQTYPTIQTYPGKRQERKPDDDAKMEMPSQTPYVPCYPQVPRFSPYEWRGVNKAVQFRSSAHNRGSMYRGDRIIGQKPVTYSSTTTAGCITTNASVVTVRANDSSLFIASSASTTSQTEREFSLHDAKMQLTKSPGLSTITAPPPSPDSSLCSLSVSGRLLDKLPAQPNLSNEDKPHLGLDMLSDVSLLVESLTQQGSQGSSSHSGDSQSAVASCCSSSSAAISGLDCELEDNSETAMSQPQVPQVRSLPPDLEHTIAMPTAVKVENTNMLPEEGLEYTTMNKVAIINSVCYPPEGPNQAQNILMLPPKKSTKFTKGLTEGPQSAPIQDGKKKHHEFKKSSGGQPENQEQRAKPQMEKEKNQGALKFGNSGTKKRGRPCKVKEETERRVSATSNEYSQTSIVETWEMCRERIHREHGYPQKIDSTRENKTIHSQPGMQTTTTAAHQSTTAGESSYAENISTVDASSSASALAGQGPMGIDLLSYAVSVGDDSANAVYKSEEHESGASNSSLAKSEAAIVPLGEQLQVLDALEMMQVEVYDETCQKVHFDPLLIAEEEVTSTLPIDLLTVSVETTDHITDHCKAKTKTGRKRKSHSCMYCCSTHLFDEEFLSSNSTEQRCSKSGKTKRKSSKGHAGKFSYKSCKKSVKDSMSKMVYDSCKMISSSSSQNSGSGKGSVDKTKKMCNVCGRLFISVNNLTRHRRQFHPSIFFSEDPTGAHIVELPLASPLNCCSSVSCTASTKSETISLFSISPTKSLSGILSCSSITDMACMKTPPTPQNSPCPLAFQLSKKILPNVDEENKKSDDVSDELEHHFIPRKRRRRRRRRRNLSKCEDMDWLPPKRWKSEIQLSPRGQKQRVLKNGYEQPAASQPRKTKKAKRKRASRKRKTENRRLYKMPDTAPAADPAGNSADAESDNQLKCTLNFRTKKRTRINSTIQCPYCQRLFSVMSNLKRHTKKQHNDVNIFVCNICFVKTNMRRRLNKHMKSHADYFPYKCVDCLSRFQSEGELKAHQSTHHINRFPCQDCDLVFYTEDHLNDHMAQYHIKQQDSE